MFTTKSAWGGFAIAGLSVVSLGFLARGDTSDSRAVSRREMQASPRSVQTTDTAPTMSAQFLRRLGEAVAGYRTGEPVYVVASSRFPFEVAGVYSTRDSASAARASFPLNRVFGPFVTPLDFGQASVLAPLRHVRPTIWMFDSLPETAWQEHDVDSVAITVYHHSRRTWHTVSRGLDVDAVFFTLAAIDKFAIPYYANLYGPAYADSLRRSVGAYIQRIPER